MAFPPREAYERLLYKHNRRPAPGISFAEPNLTTLIADIASISL